MARLASNAYHVPVMAAECLEYMDVCRGGVIVDATLGGGGHSRLLLQQMKAGSTLVAFDADEYAIERAAPLADLAEQNHCTLKLVHANFATMSAHLASVAPVTAVLFDLGVSSFQFDYHPRGFSYRQNSPLDMRFSPEGTSAADLVNSLSEADLARLLRDYSQEPLAKRLAGAIVRRRTLAPYKTTVDLRDTVLQHSPPQYQAKTLARVFQALRIAVNNELENLSHALQSVLPMMSVGGSVVVMSYHSLEDKVVKEVFKQHSSSGSVPLVEVLTRKPVMASETEVAQNPRSRSARLRAARILKL